MDDLDADLSLATEPLSAEAMLASLSSTGSARRTVTIAGKYVLQREIARGAMGRVFLARQLRLDRIVAVKVVTESANEDFHRRFLLEATALAAVNHRNIVTIYDSGESGRLLYLAMEYLQGRTLADAVVAEGTFTVEHALSVAIQVARGLRAAHKKGIVHRDLKPSNLFLTTDEEGEVVKVFDFGVAKNTQPLGGPVSDATRDGLIVGTPSFMAPEQIEAGVIDGRTDLYALGCVLHLMLTGQPPFTAPNELEVLLAHLKQSVTPLRSIVGNEALPAAVDDVVMRLLQKAPEGRFADADAAVAALQAAANSLRPDESALRLRAQTWGAAPILADGVRAEDAPTVTRSSPAAVQPRPAPRRFPLVAAAVGAVGLAGIAWLVLRTSPAPTTALSTPTAVAPTATPAAAPPPTSTPTNVPATTAAPTVPVASTSNATTASPSSAPTASPSSAPTTTAPSLRRKVRPSAAPTTTATTSATPTATPTATEATPAPRVRPRIGIVDDEPAPPSPAQP